MNGQTLPLFDGVVDTSRAALESIDARKLREQVLDALRRWGHGTADELAAWLDVDRLSIRPRCSELRALGDIADSGRRRRNKSGKAAIVWVPTAPTTHG